MVSPKVCDAQLQAAWPNETLALATLDLRCWQSVCVVTQVFGKKLLQLINKTATKKRPQAGALDIHIGRVRGKF
jgi:hypothetical protein